MRLIFSFLIPLFLFGYYGKVEPIETYIIKSDVVGKVIKSDTFLESQNLMNQEVVLIDSFNDKKDLENLLHQRELIQSQISFHQDNLKNQEEIYRLKKEIYESYKNLKSKSKTEKDLKYFDYLNAKNQYNQTKITIQNLKVNLSNINTNISKLQNSINKKSFRVNGYLYKVFVKKGDFVNMGVPVLEVMDISKEKIVIFVPINKIDRIKNRKIYLNGKLSNFIVSKIYRVADEKFVTSYRVELIGNYDKISDVVKVEFK